MKIMSFRSSARLALILTFLIALPIILQSGVYAEDNATVLPYKDEFSDSPQESVPASEYVKGNSSSKEMRGVWIASVFNIDFPSAKGLSAEQQKQEIDSIIKNCLEANLNAIFFQVRPSADALYDSSIFPTSEFLSGTQGGKFAGGFDPLKYIIEQAHNNGIELHAWINPYRITMGSEASPKHDVSALSKNHPARLHPEYTVPYADGKLYFNPGLPEVQSLIVDGVKEIVKKYDVDGIHFDDYFYPDPVYKQVNGKSTKVEFDDAATYKKYGKNYSNIEDFRRASVNDLMKKVYAAIKVIDKNCRFGISPKGIWANSSSNPAGSNTKGFEAYYAIYSDATAWIKDKSVDYICPQIYWSFSNPNARYDILVRWWSTLLDGTGVDLYIGHAAYKLTSDPLFKNSLEIPRQVEYARNYISVKGSVFYGYSDVAANSYQLKTKLAKLYSQPYDMSPSAAAVSKVTIGRPSSGSTVTESSYYVTGGSDPKYPVYYNNVKMTRTKSGFFSVFVNLSDGKNTLAFKQNGETVNHIINKGKIAASADKSSYVYPQMDSYKIEPLAPKNNYITKPGTKIVIKVQAPSNSAVTATLGGLTVKLTPLTEPPDEGAYMTEIYSGTITLPDKKAGDSPIDYGNIVYKATRNKESAEAKGVSVMVVSESTKIIAEVVNDYSHLKINPSSSFYDDYLPSSVGMMDYVEAIEEGYYKLRFGGYILEENVKLSYGKPLNENKINFAGMSNEGEYTLLKIAVMTYVPINAYCKDGVFNITMYNTPSNANMNMALVSNPIFSDVKASYDEKAKTVSYKLNLKNAENFYGFEVFNENGCIEIRVKNPRKIEDPAMPLKGMTIVVDAGHGGGDTGTLGFLGKNGKSEKDLNLEISLALEKKLKALGAEVVMTRTDDKTVDPQPRMELFNAVNPDLLLSIHHNSMPNSGDNSLISGILPLYCNDAGMLLATAVCSKLSEELNRMLRDRRYQMLAVLRNHKFPAATIEMSFITCPDEFEIAQSPKNIERSVQGLANGVVEYFNAQAKFLK